MRMLFLSPLFFGLINSTLPSFAAETDLPAAVARELSEIKLTGEQSARLERLVREHKQRLAETQAKVDAHELPRWRVYALGDDFRSQVAALLTPEQKQARLLKILQLPSVPIEFVLTPLHDVFEYLQDAIPGLHVWIDRAALRRVNRSFETPITMNIKGTTLDSAVRLTLRSIGLVDVAKDGMLIVTSEEEGKRLLALGAIDPDRLLSPMRAALHKRLQTALRQPVTAESISVEFKETPLKEVAEFFNDTCHVQILIDERAMSAAADVDFDVRCTARIKNISLDAALDKVLGKFGLKHVISDEVILIIADPAAHPRSAAMPSEVAGSPCVKPHSDEREAVERLDRLGADVELDADGRVQRISFASARDGDAVLAAASPLKHLRAFLPSWEVRTMVTDRGLASLSGMTQLQSLTLNETAITDAGLRHLANLVDLEDLDLEGNQIDGSGFAALAALGKLKSLNLAETQASDACLKHLGKLTVLASLNLAGTCITDAGLAHLRGLKNLEEMTLDGTGITDSGLETLKELPKLRSVSLRKTHATPKGIVELTKLLKKLQPAPRGSSDDPFGP